MYRVYQCMGDAACMLWDVVLIDVGPVQDDEASWCLLPVHVAIALVAFAGVPRGAISQ